MCSGKQSNEKVDRKQMKKKVPNQVGLVAGEFQTAQRSAGKKGFAEKLNSKPLFFEVENETKIVNIISQIIILYKYQWPQIFSPS